MLIYLRPKETILNYQPESPHNDVIVNLEYKCFVILMIHAPTAHARGKPHLRRDREWWERRACRRFGCRRHHHWCRRRRRHHHHH